MYDPELNLNVYDLGLIYEVAVNKEYDAQVIMTLTTPIVRGRNNSNGSRVLFRAVECVNKVNVVLTFDPIWIPM